MNSGTVNHNVQRCVFLKATTADVQLMLNKIAELLQKPHLALLDYLPPIELNKTRGLHFEFSKRMT